MSQTTRADSDASLYHHDFRLLDSAGISNAAMASLAFGILGFLLLLLPYYGVISLFAVVLSIISLVNFRRGAYGSAAQGRGIAIGGLCLGGLGFLANLALSLSGLTLVNFLLGL